MKAIFIETQEFTERIAEHLPDDAYDVLQQELMENPNSGDAMPGYGGLRKIRTSDPKRGKGKRGGARVIYLHVPVANRFYMLAVYSKDEKEDLWTVERKLLRKLAEQLKKEATEAQERLRKENE